MFEWWVWLIAVMYLIIGLILGFIGAFAAGANMYSRKGMSVGDWLMAIFGWPLLIVVLFIVILVEGCRAIFAQLSELGPQKPETPPET